MATLFRPFAAAAALITLGSPRPVAQLQVTDGSAKGNVHQFGPDLLLKKACHPAIWATQKNGVGHENTLSVVQPPVWPLAVGRRYRFGGNFLLFINEFHFTDKMACTGYLN